MEIAAPAPSRPRQVEDVLRTAGLTPFHRRAVLVTGAAWTFVAMEILIVGFTVPVFTSIWGLSGSMAGWIAASALGGALLGAVVLGRLSDRIGRRRIFQLSILWYAVFTALTALAWGPWSLSAFRLLAGIGLGGILVVDPSLLAEYLPPQRRGRLLVLLDLFWPVGLLLATGLSWIFLDQVGGENGWRYLFLAAAFPAFLAFVARLTLPESPYYLARSGRTTEAAEVLSEIAGSDVDGRTLEAPGEQRTSLREFASERLRSSTALVLVVWVALNISYYGLFLWLPFVLQTEERFTVNVYLLLALSALSQ
ncbi:MAG: MFS transporter, partial [Gaiellaceae bacterium]